MLKSKKATVINTVAPLNLEECLAKTYRAENGKHYPGRSVFNHCEIVAHVARELISRMPNWLQTSFFPPGSELVAGAHDIGKVSPHFQEKIYRGTSDYTHNSHPCLKNIDPALEKNWGGHAGVSQLTADNLKSGKYIPEILGQHHGYSPSINGRISDDEIFGGLAWHQQRIHLTEDLKNKLQCDWPRIESTVQAKVLSGLTTVSDWIGSGKFFEDPVSDWKSCIKPAVDDAGFIRPELKPNLTFGDIFNFSAKEAQEQLFQQATNPGVYILEAPMGLGKTEAALYAAYLAMCAHRTTGFYFALPTQLTSDKIYSRVNEFLKKILEADTYHQRAFLIHGNAWLKDTEMGEEGKPGGSWFNSLKRSILAPFAVGTIDQALMSAMNVKHGFVRTFGLAGKVVILDEVHTYDVYTGTLLQELISELRELQCIVIILSATLTRKQRETFLAQTSQSTHYPLISSSPNNCEISELKVATVETSKVTLKQCEENNHAIEEALLRADQGQQVLWIENTVAEAQEQFSKLCARATEMNIETGLLHSRFIKVDREAHEDKWVALFSKQCATRQQYGRILMGTQVLEQSLDIDADFLVTRICPTDMLLQRIGRLWRHSSTLRPVHAKREVWILSPKLESAIQNAEAAFGKTAKDIYPLYILCRSLEVFHLLNEICLPLQIRDLLEKTYSEREETDTLAQYKQALLHKREKLSGLALVGLAKGGMTRSDSEAATRYGEYDSIEVLLLKTFQIEKEKNAIRITLLNNEELFLPANIKSLDRRLWKKYAATLMRHMIKVPEHLAPDIDKSIARYFQDYLYIGEDGDAIRIAKVDAAERVVNLHNGAASEKYEISYDARLGYRASKK